MIYKIIIDTNVIVAGLISNRGASFKLLSCLNDSRIEVYLSNPIIFEYEEVLKRNKKLIKLDEKEIDMFVDDICSIATEKNIYFLWRPSLSDTDDEMFIDLAIASNINYIITFNISNFSKAKNMGIKIITPQEFLRILGEIQ